MTNTSYEVRHDGVNPATCMPRTPEHDTTTNGNAYKLSAITNSTAGVLANGAPCHFDDEWKPESEDRCRCNMSQNEPLYSLMQHILDLLKEQRAPPPSQKSKMEKKIHDQSDLAMVEWQMVAMVADRVIFITFTVLILSIYAIIFSRVPV